jgi:hypothetical protein
MLSDSALQCFAKRSSPIEVKSNAIPSFMNARKIAGVKFALIEYAIFSGPLNFAYALQSSLTFECNVSSSIR